MLPHLQDLYWLSGQTLFYLLIDLYFNSHPWSTQIISCSVSFEPETCNKHVGKGFIRYKWKIKRFHTSVKKDINLWRAFLLFHMSTYNVWYVGTMYMYNILKLYGRQRSKTMTMWQRKKGNTLIEYLTRDKFISRY